MKRKVCSIMTILLFILMTISVGNTEKAFECWIVTQYNDASGNQSMFYTIEDTETNDLIIIDGGWVENAAQVKTVIDQHGGHVNAWILTHYHGDHAGAFTVLYDEYKDRIDKIYATPLIWDDFIESAQYWDTPEIFEEFRNLTKDEDKVVYLNNGDEFDIGRFHVKNFNTYDEFVQNNGDIANNCSLVLKVTMGNNSILFCGDTYGGNMSRHLIDLYGDELKADIVQPGHHGNNTLLVSFYEFVDPQIMTFDAPEWIMIGENYTAKDLKAWCEEHSIKVLDQSTAPNIITIEELENK